MKKIVITIAVLMIANFVSAQQDTTTTHRDTVWRSGGIFAVNFSQVSLTHWAGGGQNAISLNAIANYFAHYKRAKNSWDNDFNLGYGFTMQDNSPAIKNDDRIDLTTKYGREASGHWYYSSLLNFRSQFTNGYNYPNDSTVISKFLAPGYILLALGMDFKPTDNFSMFISPATARFIIVDDDTLSAHGAFGVDSGKTVKTEVGAYIKVSYNKNLTSAMNLQTEADVFSNYLKNPQNLTVNWQLLLAVKISKFISASVSTQLIYDPLVQLTYYKSDGITVDHVGVGTQFKELVGIGLAYKFSGVTVK